jgi:putative hemolysin
MPGWIDGRNSPAFYGAGRVHPRLRTLLLGRELLKQRGSVAHVFLGKAFGRDAVRAQQTPEAVTKTLRNAVDAIALEAGSVRSTQAIAPAIHSVLLAQDVQRLPATARLIASGVYDVFCAGAQVLPHVLPEIGRLREITFRAVGEGTGLALDLDRFDAHYEHLFVWNRVRCEVVGAYRVGATDRIVAAHGIQGLYTRTLFRYDDRLLRRLSPALELGRSFVRAEYQRSYNALLLLWKGIGHLVARAPDYRVLFGPVSISRRYQDSTQEMLRVFLAEHCSDPALTELVEAVQPPSAVLRPARSAAPVADVDELDAVIRSIERSQGMPVLLRQYLRLNATVLGFNVDPAFGDALDALMMVDLTRLPSATLQRYLGRAEADAFLARHAARTAPQVAA